MKLHALWIVIPTVDLVGQMKIPAVTEIHALVLTAAALALLLLSAFQAFAALHAEELGFAGFVFTSLFAVSSAARFSFAQTELSAHGLALPKICSRGGSCFTRSNGFFLANCMGGRAPGDYKKRNHHDLKKTFHGYSILVTSWPPRTFGGWKGRAKRVVSRHEDCKTKTIFSESTLKKKPRPDAMIPLPRVLTKL